MTHNESLPVRQLGLTDMHITRVGFGSWAVGGDWAVGWGSQDDRDSVAAIRHAVACGINWIDTAAIYGVGHSEEVVASALSAIPRSERPYIFTKCGLVSDPADRAAMPRQVGAPASLRREIEDSLHRLQTEHRLRSIGKLCSSLSAKARSRLLDYPIIMPRNWRLPKRSDTSIPCNHHFPQSSGMSVPPNCLGVISTGPV
jgi:hypothetical protein